MLQAHKSSPEEERLFVLFRDATSGKQTHGAGRYLGLSNRTEIALVREKGILDFN